ncbi:MAG: NAD(P) transhydrogenase subunit alpha [Chlamydiota bacterium]
MEVMMLLMFILMLSGFLGFELIGKVPSTLHTPLMSGANAISGITLLGAMIGAGMEASMLSKILSFFAVVFATINIVGGYLVTNRMLAMFQQKEDRS